MNKIIKLSEKIIKQIAAGEVIQKPYNAIKELIENAIDANSTEINIYLENQGLSSIIIIDNGVGIEKQDLKLATKLHTTSKTKESDKIFGTNFLGFRGEALASIDAISNLTIESKGQKLENENITSSNIKKGTKITIKNIFEKTPARLKFIKNPNLEFKFIKEIIKKYIINYENIKWTVHHNKKNIFNNEITTKKSRIDKLFNEESILKEERYNNLIIKAYILKKNTNTKIIYANNRPIKDKAIIKYISSLFKEYTFINEEPGYIIFITTPDIFIDYNVHPAKEEVKFFNYNEIFDIINNIFSLETLSYQLNNKEIIIETIKKEYKNEEPEKPKIIYEEIKLINTIEQKDTKEIQEETFKNEIEKIEIEETNFNIIGQLKNSYILFETENNLGIFDQHASHERIIYEQIKNEMKKSNAQTLLTPIKLNLTIKQEEFIKENNNFLTEKGIIINNNKINSIPNFSKDINFKEFFENLIIPCNIQTEFNRLFANIACKKAIKANHSLSKEQMQSLLKEALKNPPICNHGRPVFKYFSNNEILNFFKRT